VAKVDQTRTIIGLAIIGVVSLLIVWTSWQLEPAHQPPAPTSAVPVQGRIASEPTPAPVRPIAAPSNSTVLDPAPVVRETSPAASVPASGAKPSPPSEPPGNVTADLDEVQSALRDFRSEMGGNPVGTNAEIVKALLGDNLKQVKLPVPIGSQINAQGELCDRWGTPYFFHQLSQDRMEVRSAGPDRKMWTADDRQL
jgi:hypothetical protein